MRIALGSVDVSDLHRRAIANRYGDSSLASRERCREFVLRNGLHALDDVVADLEAEEEARS